MRLHLDYETACDLDIKKVGLRRYVNHASFRVLMTAWAVGDGPVQQVEGFADLPWRDCTVHAFKAPFERAAIARYGVALPPAYFRCTMTHAYARGFSGDLAQVGAQLGIPQDKAKLADGTRLITKFCKPRRPSKANPDKYWTPETAPDDWDRFLLYNRQDVEAERSVYHLLSPYPMTGDELETMWWDWEVNDRGLPINPTLVANAIELAGRYQEQTEERIKELTGGISGNQVGALLEWCRENGLPDLENLQAGTIRETLKAQEG